MGKTPDQAAFLLVFRHSKKKGPPGNFVQAGPFTVKKWLHNKSPGHSTGVDCRKILIRHTPAVVPKIYGRHPCLADSWPQGATDDAEVFFANLLCRWRAKVPKIGLVES